MKGIKKKTVSILCSLSLLLGLFAVNSPLKAAAAANTITYTSSNPLVLTFSINSQYSGYWYMAGYLAPDAVQYPVGIENLYTSIYNPYTQSAMNLGTWSYPTLHSDYRGTLAVDSSFGESYYFDDNSGYMEVHYTGTIYEDTQAPTISLSGSGWSNSTVTVTADVSDSGSGVAVKKWAEGSYVASSFDSGSLGTTFTGNTFTVTKNDTYTVYAKDVAGNETSNSIYVDTIDNTPPAMTLSEYSWSAGNETVKATITDNGSGIAVQKYAGGSQTATYFTNGGTAFTGSMFTLTVNGTYTVYARDNAGNTTLKTISVSHIESSGCPAINYTSDAPFEIYYIYSVNMPSGLIYPWPNGFPQVLNYPDDIQEEMNPVFGEGGNKSILENVMSFPILQDGYRGKLTYIGIVGGAQINQFAMRIGGYVGTIYQDTTPPDIQLQESDWSQGSCSVIATIADNGSGLAVQKWAQGSQTAGYFASSGNTLSGPSFLVTANGIYTVYAKDQAGNEAVKTITVDHIDNAAPAIILTPQSSWGKANTIIATISDSQSGLSLTKWAEGNQSVAYFSSNGTAFTGSSITVQTNDIYTFYAADSVGNKAVNTVTVNHVDTTAPAVSCNLSPNSTTSGNVTVSISASDSQSGVSSIKLPDGSIVNGTSASYVVTSNGAYSFVITDAAGNQVTFPAAVSNIVKMISVTHPVDLAYSIDPNHTPVITAPDLPITNNSDVPVSVSVGSFAATSGGSLTLRDVSPDKYANWDALTRAQTESDIALGLQVKENTTGTDTWESIYVKSPLYAASTQNESYVMGILNAHGIGHLDLSGKCGLAWDAANTAEHKLVLVFQLI